MKNSEELKVTTEEIAEEDNTIEKDRRAHKRYRVKEGALALIDNSPGTIVDISTGGLTVNYIVFGNEPRKAMRLDIFLSSEDFYLHDVPARLINSYEQEKASGSENLIQVKRYGLQFGELTNHQRETIKYFILHNTVAEG